MLILSTGFRKNVSVRTERYGETDMTKLIAFFEILRTRVETEETKQQYFSNCNTFSLV